MNYQLSASQLEQILARPEYRAINYPSHSHPHFENLKTFGDTLNLFDELTEQLGRVPTQTEYVNEGLKRAESYFRPRPNHKPNVTKYWGKGYSQSATFNWSDLELQTAVKKRLSRTYPSLLVEYSTIIQLKALYPDYLIGANHWLDHTAGVDIVVASPKHNRIIYIHITSKSYHSSYNLNDKKTRKGVAEDKNGKLHFFTRNFNKGHLHLVFDKFSETDSTKIVNGNPILKPEHLKLTIDSAMQIPDPNNQRFDTWYNGTGKIQGHQLYELHAWLLLNKITEEGLGNIWV